MGRMPKLTPRQRAFLDKLRELYRERRGPVHYTAVAERLGVSRFSAYDMLKVLEQKGFAASSYALAAQRAGPGRSMVFFAPTSADTGLTNSEMGEDWQNVRHRVLGKLREARQTSYRAALSDLLGRMPEPQAPLAFCTGMVGAFLLNMSRVPGRARKLGPFRALASLRASGVAGLDIIAGLSLGSTLLSEEPDGDPSISQRMVEQARHYQASLSRLNAEARSALDQFLEEALDALD